MALVEVEAQQVRAQMPRLLEEATAVLGPAQQLPDHL
jgi:hypothetical protein